MARARYYAVFATDKPGMHEVRERYCHVVKGRASEDVEREYS
jgi:hypothetical protein